MSIQGLNFDIPPVATRRWRRAIDTSVPSSHDIALPGDKIDVKPADGYRVNARSVVVLISSGRPPAQGNRGALDKHPAISSPGLA